MNEWQLQRRLTRTWAKTGLDFLGNRLFLVAWEVMHPCWEINNPNEHWTDPSLDFLFCDREGDLWCLEIKNSIDASRDAYCALCQVTTRAIGLKDSYRFARLNDVYRNAYCGHHGRVLRQKIGPLDLRAAHQAFFELSVPLPPRHFNRHEMRRIVGARRFGRSWYPLLQRFNYVAPEKIASRLCRQYMLESKANLELKRYVEQVENGAVEFKEQVRYLRLAPTHAPELASA